MTMSVNLVGACCSVIILYSHNGGVAVSLISMVCAAHPDGGCDPAWSACTSCSKGDLLFKAIKDFTLDASSEYWSAAISCIRPCCLPPLSAL
ncbi:hypothetical protein GDO81_024772 [Engystomops pustulosus]|uniref:Secreted protein n=1 Tax=Engystomops pustulosus TaxID=76066 RepID=A0AAV6YQN9_ENGPU|nr:hypothetical protein GDO81_024772 [Engystomops pustulosus]